MSNECEFEQRIAALKEQISFHRDKLQILYEAYYSAIREAKKAYRRRCRESISSRAHYAGRGGIISSS